MQALPGAIPRWGSRGVLCLLPPVRAPGRSRATSGMPPNACLRPRPPDMRCLLPSKIITICASSSLSYTYLGHGGEGQTAPLGRVPAAGTGRWRLARHASEEATKKRGAGHSLASRPSESLPPSRPSWSVSPKRSHAAF